MRVIIAVMNTVIIFWNPVVGSYRESVVTVFDLGGVVLGIIFLLIFVRVAGKIEKEEKVWETAIRELKEETRLDPVRMFVADHVSHFYETHDCRIITGSTLCPFSEWR